MVKVNHDLRSNNGVTVCLPPSPDAETVSLAVPDVHAAGPQRYPIGTLAWYAGVGKKFRYCKAGEDITEATSARMLANGNYAAGAVAGAYGIAANEHGFNGTIYAQAEIDQEYIDIPITTVGKNFYQGGHLQLLPGANPLSQYYIIASDKSETAYTRVYIDKPITQVVTTAMYAGISACPYSKLINGDFALAGARYISFMGLPLVNCSSGEFFWLQTAGPCWIQPSGWTDSRCPGYGANYRDVYAAIDGAIASAGHLPPTDGYQRVGYLIDATAAGYGSVFIMLQLEG